MKKLFVFIIAGVALAACNNAADATDRTKDSLDSVAREEKRAVDSAARQEKKDIDSLTDAQKQQLESDTGTRN